MLGEQAAACFRVPLWRAVCRASFLGRRHRLPGSYPPMDFGASEWCDATSLRDPVCPGLGGLRRKPFLFLTPEVATSPVADSLPLTQPFSDFLSCCLNWGAKTQGRLAVGLLAPPITVTGWVSCRGQGQWPAVPGLSIMGCLPEPTLCFHGVRPPRQLSIVVKSFPSWLPRPLPSLRVLVL